MEKIEKIRYGIKNKKIKEVKKSNFSILSYINKILFVSLLTVITLILTKTSTNFKSNFYKYIYEDNISFASINNLYTKYFGSPMPFSNILKTKMVFNEKLTYSSSEKYKDGVKLVVSNNYMIPALEEGMVIFVGDKEGYGNTVIMEANDGIEIWYSNINSNLKIYDYIQKGDLVGEANGELYLVFKKNGEILNYEEYI